ncbi:hypothetical protein N656DRAFT_777811 [Canariomyces notabilis]|uniref:Uncharacterized protein n=1 Tax=Canariomyces notabilis TaxID=2074819 RepID=A0AAN6TH55_9PEZI|nr:hypothetical protein N656DRAFT_777811 [Canariomyces arenarius]
MHHDSTFQPAGTTLSVGFQPPAIASCLACGHGYLSGARHFDSLLEDRRVLSDLTPRSVRAVLFQPKQPEHYRQGPACTPPSKADAESLSRAQLSVSVVKDPATYNLPRYYLISSIGSPQRCSISGAYQAWKLAGCTCLTLMRRGRRRDKKPIWSQSSGDVPCLKRPPVLLMQRALTHQVRTPFGKR